MVILLSLFVVAAIALYFAFLYVRKNNTEKIAALNQALQQLTQSEVVAQFPKLKRLNLTGSSQAQFSELQKAFKSITNAQLPQLAEDLNEVGDANEHYRFMLVKADLNHIASEYAKAKVRLSELNSKAQKMLTEVNTCQKNFEQVKQGFETIRKTLLAKSFMFDLASEVLDSRLQMLNAQLTKVYEVMGKADYQLAKTQLQSAQKLLDELKQCIAVIPDLIHTYKSVFPSQLQEIVSSYQQMTKKGIGFSSDFTQRVASANDLLGQLKDSLTAADVNQATLDEQQLKDQIEKLYATLEKGYKDQQKAQQHLNMLEKFIHHAQKRQHVLEMQLDRLNQSYVLTHGELDQSHDLEEKLAKVALQFEQMQQSVKQSQSAAKKKVDYAAVVAEQEKQIAVLQQIEHAQSQLKKSTEGLCDSERMCKNTLEDFSDTLNKLKRQIDDALLNGLPDGYIELFNRVAAAIKQQKMATSRSKIDVEVIANDVEQLGADVSDLTKRTDKLLESAWLCERLVAHANRYKNRYDEVAAAINKASQLFNETYDYNAACETIAMALEKVEPGVYERALTDYRRP